MILRRIVSSIQAAVLAATVATVALLGASAPAPDPTMSFGASVFAANCASCHGTDATGLVGPDLTSGHVFERFESRAEMMTFVSNGFGGMPAMGERLGVGEIGAVVDFVRSGAVP